MTGPVGGSSGSQDEPEKDPFDIVLDEDFIRAAKVTEASARSRALAGQWKREPPPSMAWRDEFRVEKRRRRRWPAALAALVLLVGAAAALIPKMGKKSHAPTATPGTTSSASPSASPTPTDPDARYFAGSPAAAYASGENAIAPPVAVAIGPFSAASVAGDYAALKRMLVDANLNPSVLYGGRPIVFLTMQDPKDNVGSDLEKALANPSKTADPTNWITRFNPAKTKLLGHTIKVNGGMSDRLSPSGSLLVTADYLFVYAVGPADGGGRSTRVVIHRSLQIETGKPGQFDVTPGTYWVSDSDSAKSNDVCFVYDGFINPAFGGDSQATGAPVDPYATATLLPDTPTPTPTATGDQGCGTITRI